MCSIFGIFNLQPSDNLQILRHQALECLATATASRTRLERRLR